MSRRHTEGSHASSGRVTVAGTMYFNSCSSEPKDAGSSAAAMTGARVKAPRSVTRVSGPRDPRERHQLHGDPAALWLDHHRVERLALRIVVRIDRVDLRLQLRGYRVDLLLHAFPRVLRAPHVLVLLHPAAHAAGSGRHTPEIRDAHRLPGRQHAEDGTRNRDP